MPNYYRKPLLIALALHVLIFCVLIFNFAPTVFRAPPSSAPVQLIHAKAIIESASDVTRPAPKPVQAPEHKIEPAKKPVEKKSPPPKPKQITVEQKTKMLEQKKLLQEKAVEKKEKQMEAKARSMMKAEAAQAIKKAQQAAAIKLQSEQKKLQQQLMQQQMLSEEKNISTIVSQAQQGEIDKYKAAIMAAIQSNWRIDKVDNKLKCVYSVSIAPDGTVLSEKLVKSSGDDNLDQSAKQAIIASSPLPVPTKPALFNHFRQLILTLSPQGYVQNT